MKKIGVYRDGKRLKIAALNERGLIERLDQPSYFSKEEWPGLVVSGINGNQVLVRHIESPLKKKRALEKTLPFQLENLIPYSLDEVIVRPIYQIGKEATEATFFVISTQALEAHLNSMEDFNPSWVSCVPVALQRFAAFVGEEKESYVIFHVGQLATEIVSIYRETVQHAVSIPMGIEQLELSYKKDFPEESPSQRIDSIRRLDLRGLPCEKYPHLHRALQEFEREVDRAFCFLKHKQNKEQLKFLLFAGETETLFQLEPYLKTLEGFSFFLLPVERHRGYDPVVFKAYAIAIGLSLDALKRDQKSVQFRQGEWIAREVYEQIKRRVAKGAFFSFIFALAFFVVGHLVYQKEKGLLLEAVDDFTALYGKKIPEIKKSHFFSGPREKIQFLDRNIKIVKSDQRYFSPPPLVADVLAFLAHHPILNRQDGDKKITINHFCYELIKFPSLEMPLSPYRAKVSLEFVSPDSSWARDVHDALVEDETYLDLEEAVTWDRKQNVYSLSFILK